MADPARWLCPPSAWRAQHSSSSDRTPMQMLVSYPYLKLYLHQGASRALEAQWNGVPTSTLLRQATLKCVILAREHRVGGWIADDRELGPVPPADLEWVATYVLPLLIKGGVQRFARLEVVAPLTQPVIGPAQERAQQQLSFELRSFTDPEAARAWAIG